jgi:hypothetical protein
MSLPLPMGQKESLHLEFKAREVLESPEKIAREVVGMLNADGGEVWVGIAEKDGLAAEIEPIDNVELTRRKLRDHLLDTIEPPPLSEEMQVEPVPLEDGRAVLRVRIQPGQRKPYAQLYKLMRTYVVRVEDRLRHMSREEIGDSFRNEQKALDRRQETLNKVERRRAEVQAKWRAILWVYIQPAFEVAIDPSSNQSVVEPLLRDPDLTHNRDGAWNFISARDRLVLKQGRLCFGNEDWSYVEIAKSGAIELRVPLQRLHWKGPPQHLWPFALLEHPTSLFRLARELYAKFGNQLSPSSEVMASLALTGIKGWSLGPGSPNSFHSALRAHRYEEADDLVAEPVVLQWSELFEHPDWGAFRLLRQVYEAFGFPEEKIPPEFRRDTRTLVIPS